MRQHLRAGGGVSSYTPVLARLNTYFLACGHAVNHKRVINLLHLFP